MRGRISYLISSRISISMEIFGFENKLMKIPKVSIESRDDEQRFYSLIAMPLSIFPELGLGD